MSIKLKAVSAVLATSLVFAGCGKEEATTKSAEAKKTEQTAKQATEQKEVKADTVQAYKDAIAELDKAKNNEAVDFEKVTKLYKEQLQTLVQARDAEFSETIDETITAALEAGKTKQMDPIVVRQLFDKLMQKEFFQTVRHEFKEIDENWGKAEEVKEEYEEALHFYSGVLESTVTKRDAAYGTTMVDTIKGGFAEIQTAIDKDDKLAFALGKQIVDKTLMKTFYFATGAVPNGYATKTAAAAKTDEKAAKIAQSEGWAFYQSIAPYVKRHAAEEDALISKQFDLQTDVKTVDAAAVNQAFVRGLAKVALSEYAESKETFGEDKSAITSLEGALFINMIENDLKALMKPEEVTALTKTAQAHLDAVKAKDKAAADKHVAELETALNKIVQAAK